jgi:hypothetical protein
MRTWDWILCGLSGAWLLALGLVVNPELMSGMPQVLRAIFRILGTEATAAWVQAVFSVVAIWFAGRAVLLQHRSSALKDMESLSGLVRTAKTEVDIVVDLLLDTRPGRANRLGVYSDTLLDTIAQRLADFPFYSLGSSKSPGLILRLVEAIRELESVRKGAAGFGADHPGEGERSAAEAAIKAVRKSRRRIRKFAADRRRHRARWWYR